MASSHASPAAVPKMLIACCDGTWVNAFGKDSRDSPPSNVSRIIRALRQYNSTAGCSQVALYHPGVGSSGQLLDAQLGGAFGVGLDQDIREMYSFLCLNYVGGDSIVLVGFSRGAFTARSVADLVATVGLLTPEGQDRFYSIFDDYENMADEKRSDARFICPPGTLEPYRQQLGEAWIQWENRRKTQYRAWLKAQGYTRDTYWSTDSHTGARAEHEIRIAAVAVWDTVGSLGIPALPLIGLKGSAEQWKFTNTQISRKVDNAFQALALDEPRFDFLPSLWERLPDNTTTHLRQVWFPGCHSNIGGGYDDQQVANLTLAWMCDQLAGPRVGVAFDEARLTTIFKDGLRYSAAHPFPCVPQPLHRSLPFLKSTPAGARAPLPWAKKGVFVAPAAPAAEWSLGSQRLVRDREDCPGKYAHAHPDGTPAELWARGARPWALGQTRTPSSLLQRAAGLTVRRPGQFVRMDPNTNDAHPDQPLLNTNERIHASVRVRLACGGLGVDDKHVWTCTGLTGLTPVDEDDEDDGQLTPLWRLERVDGVADVSDVAGAADAAASDSPLHYPLTKVAGAGRWQWVFARKLDGAVAGKANKVDRHSNNQMPTHGPAVRVLPEELPTGPWQRLLLGLTVGNPDVLAWAAAN